MGVQDRSLKLHLAELMSPVQLSPCQSLNDSNGAATGSGGGKYGCVQIERF